MATTTPNIGLVKPAQTDFYDIDEFYNPNMDTLDKAVGDLQTEISGLEGSAERIANLEKTALRQNSDLVVDYPTVLSYVLAQEVGGSVFALHEYDSPLFSAPDCPVANWSFTYDIRKTGDNRATVIAYAYPGTTMYMRHIVNGAWKGDWARMSDTPGTIIYTVTNEAPEGYLKANGGLLYIEDFPNLWAVLGNRFGGDGVKTFHLPDLRGYFIRCLDESAGRDAGRALASTQSDAIRNITGSLQGPVGNAGGASLVALEGREGVFSNERSGNTGPNTFTATTTNYERAIVNLDISRQVPTAAENRPINIALLACIKY